MYVIYISVVTVKRIQTDLMNCLLHAVLCSAMTMVQVTSGSQLATVDSHGREQCNTSLKRDPVVYSNPFDPVL